MKHHNNMETIEKFDEYMIQAITIEENTEFLITNNKGRTLNSGITDIETAINFARQWQWIAKIKRGEEP